MMQRNTPPTRAAHRIGATILLAGALLAGCSVEGVDHAESQLYATWYTIDERGYEIDCHAVADVVRISSFNVDTGEVFVDVFDCARERGTTATIPLGDYDVDVDLVLCGGEPCDVSPYIVDGFTVSVLVDRDDVIFDLGDFELIAPRGPAV
jgi:hypothetical protein